VKRQASVPVAALVVLVLIWGYSWVMMKVGLRHSHPFDFAALRVGIGTGVLFAILLARRRPLALPGYRMAFVLGMLQVSLFIVLSNFALMQGDTGRTSVLVFTMPFWMIVFAHFIIGERMYGLQWVAVALAFAGLMLIVAPWQLKNVGASLIAVLAGSVWAISAVLSKRWPVHADPLVYTAWQLLFGFVALSIVALLHTHEPVRWNLEFALALSFSAVLATAIGWWLWTYVLARTPAGITGLNALGIPVVAVLASAIQLGERPPAVELTGMLAIAGALALLAWLGLNRGQIPRPAEKNVRDRSR